MFTSTRFLLAALVTVLTATSGMARLGQTASEIKKIYGWPERQIRKDVTYWLINEDHGDLLYSVTWNAQGRSIAESLTPVKQARFTLETVRGFMAIQLQPYEDSKTRRTIPPGEKYQFAGQNFICAEYEEIVIDEPNEIMLIWNKSINPSVMAVSPEAFNTKK